MLAFSGDSHRDHSMDPLSGETTRLLRQFRAGDAQARDGLIRRARERLSRHTRHMLRGFPGVRRWEETDDVLQNSLIRLDRALSAVTPESPRHFWNLAALQITRELRDLADHYQGPHGHGANYHTDGGCAESDGCPRSLQHNPDTEGEPASLAEWTLFHEQIQALPEAEREVFGLIWYNGLSQQEAAGVLDTSVRTVKRRWQSARLLLARALYGERPR
jgi:RNA polymerase sigma-70 factor (ECF subfamily)